MTINDSNWQFLQNATGISAPYNQMYYRYLRGLGYTGTLQQMIAKSKKGLNPSGLKNPANSSGGVIPIPNISPTSNWRMTVTDAYDSAGDPTLKAALIGSETTKARPSYVIAASAVRTIAVRVGAVAAPGGFFSYVGNLSGYTVTAEESFDSTNGIDGTWSALTANIVFPSGGNSLGKRQAVAIATGAARWVRLAITAAAGGSLTIWPMVHQRKTGNQDGYLVLGASIEGYGMRSYDLEAAILAQFPASDPVVFLYATGGVTSSTIVGYPAAALAAFGNYISYAFVGNAIGNDMTDAQPISDDTPQSLIDLRGRVDTIINGLTSKYVFAASQTYRAYTSVSPVSPAPGSLPYNQQIIAPAVLADIGYSYDAAAANSRLNLYAPAQRNRNLLDNGDAVHFGTSDGTYYAWMRDEWARIAGSRIYSTAWPLRYEETLVAIAETTLNLSDIVEASYAVNAMSSGSPKTALLARIPATPAVFMAEDFRRQEGVSILTAQHLTNTLTPWIRHTSYASGISSVRGGRLVRTSSSPDCVYSGPSFADGLVKGKFRTAATLLASNWYLAARIDVAANTMYYAGYLAASARWVVSKVVGGTITDTLGDAVVLTANTDYDLEFTLSGSTLTLRVNGVVVATLTDGTITAAGPAGPRLSGVANGTLTGTHLDWISAQAA